ncbi:OmpA family protein [Endozoicomonadaceae bacterium StTr2]
MKFRSKTVMLLTAAVLTGCQTTNPYTGEQETGKSVKYGAAGAVGGAIIGALADGKEGAWKGALLGGAAGAGYGYYVDKQEAVLRQELQGTGVQVARYGDELKLIMPADITFRLGSAAIEARFYPVLNSVGKVLKEFDDNLVRVVGYSDRYGGTPQRNLELSQQRAQSVASYLHSQGVSSTRITAFGQGASNPIVPDDGSKPLPANRRVEVDLLPPPQR